jgi:hypothetical protein
VDVGKYGIEDGKAREEIYDTPQSAQEVTSAEVEVQKADDSPERSQLDSDASPSPQPSPSEGEGVKESEKDALTKIENEPTEFRNYDGDTTCDPSWAAKPAPVMRRY